MAKINAKNDIDLKLTKIKYLCIPSIKNSIVHNQLHILNFMVLLFILSFILSK